jgi:hypothetical protein
MAGLGLPMPALLRVLFPVLPTFGTELLSDAAPCEGDQAKADQAREC